MSDKDKAEFGVHRISRNQDQLVVEGRCYKGKIGIGQEFHRVYAAIIAKTQAEYKSVGRISLAEVNVRVTRIEAYSHDLLEIEAGLTARLHLSGIGSDEVKENTILCED